MYPLLTQSMRFQAALELGCMHSTEPYHPAGLLLVGLGLLASGLQLPLQLVHASPLLLQLPIQRVHLSHWGGGGGKKSLEKIVSQRKLYDGTPLEGHP